MTEEEYFSLSPDEQAAHDFLQSVIEEAERLLAEEPETVVANSQNPIVHLAYTIKMEKGI
jgi:hypothetical protein